MTDFLQRCLGDRKAGIAIIFAVTAIPVIGVIGIGVDLGLATQAKTQLNLATDAAALAAAKGAADAFTAGQSIESARAAGQTAGQEWFKSQAGTVFGATLQDPVVTVPPPDGPVFTSQVTYQGTVKPYFAPLFGVSTITLGGSSSATITTNAYVSVTFLLDNSSSMLVASTQAGVNLLGDLTKDFNKYYPGYPVNPKDLAGLNCAFACHWNSDNNDYYGLATSKSIELRFDVLKSAVKTAMEQMETQKKIDDQFAATIYTFNSARTNKPRSNSALTQIYPSDTSQASSTNLTAGATAAKNMQTPVVEDVANTDFPSAISELVADLKKKGIRAGDGSSKESRKKALIIVTDGLVDIEPLRRVPDTKGPLKPADCAAMKNLGYNVYVLYTTFVTSPVKYVLIFNEDLLPYLNDTNGPGTSPMALALQACASAPANFAQASDPDAIKAAMSQLLKAALANGGRYTQ